MIITICASMTLAERIRTVQEQLRALGHTVYVPVEVEEFDYQDATTEERADLKRTHDLIREHWRKIQRSDAILVLNEDAKGFRHYIGGNSFLEMGFAHILHLPIYLMHDVPDMPYASEMEAMDVAIIRGDLTRMPLTPPARPDLSFPPGKEPLEGREPAPPVRPEPVEGGTDSGTRNEAVERAP